MFVASAVSGYTDQQINQLSRIFRARVDIDTEIVTMVYTTVIQHVKSSSHGAGNTSAITKIVGLF